MYVQGFLIAVPESKKDAYTKMARDAAEAFKRYGVLEIVEAWEDDVTDGKVTDFRMATKAEPGEKIVFSWMIWPDRETYQASGEKMQSDPFFEQMGEMPFDGMRMMWGGFTPIFTMGRD